jgi:phage/plasmid primase-like uncharacterized protein
MVGGVSRWPGRTVTGIHRTFLNEDGSGKASVRPDKMMLGECAGGALRLAAAGPLLVVTEGIETALSVMQAIELPTWAALSAVGLERLLLPELPLASEVIIAADEDARGLQAAARAAARWIREGRRVRVARPASGLNDFNDVLRWSPR